MQNKKLHFFPSLAVAALLAGLVLPVWAAPDFPAPPGAKVTWVGKDVVWNGIPMSVRKFTTTKSKKKVVTFYKKKWAEPVAPDAPGFIEQDMPDGQMISRLEDGYLMSVHIKTSNFSDTWGYLGMSKIEEDVGKLSSGSDFPRMSGSEVLNEIKHNDSFRNSKTIMMQNKYSVSSNVEYYRSHFSGQGWNISMDQKMINGAGHAVMATKNGSEVSLTVVRTNTGSQVVANIVE